MHTITRIVVGVDGSDGGQAAATWAAQWAADHDLPLHLVTATPAAVQVGGEATPFSDSRWDALVDHLADQAAERLGTLRGRVQAEHPQVRVTTETVRGRPAVVLMDAVGPGDVLVVGRTGVTGWAKRVMGGVAEEVTTYADVPVVVVPHSATASSSCPVVVGLDMESSTGALKVAAWDAAARGRRLHLVSANDMGDITDGFVTLLNNELPGYLRRRFVALQARVIDSLSDHEPALEVSRSVVDGDAAQALADAGQRASLLVVGSRGHGGFTRLMLGSTSQELVREANCPILVIPERLHGQTPAPARKNAS